jgi:hypothetical protein
MGQLHNDIKAGTGWIVQAFAADGFKLDYSLESFHEIDRFFDLHVKDGTAVPEGRLSTNLGPVIFSIGAYVGETLVKLIPGTEWRTDDNDPQGEIAVSLHLPGGGEVWPVQKVIARFHNGNEDSIYAYGKVLVQDQL